MGSSIQPPLPLSQKIEELKELPTLQRKNDLPEIYKRISEFMREVRETFLSPKNGAAKLPSYSWTLEEKKILEEAKPLIDEIYIEHLSHSLSFIDEDPHLWTGLCYQRSNIEAFNQLFKGILEPFDMEGMDRGMEMRAATNHVIAAKRPPSIPKEHWWWFDQTKKGEGSSF